MVPPGDISLVSKIATEQAVHPAHCWLMPGRTRFPNNSAGANRSELQPGKEEVPCWFFLIECWLLGTVNLTPLMPVTLQTLEPLPRKLELSLSEISSENSWVPALKITPQEADTEITLLLQTTTPESKDWRAQSPPAVLPLGQFCELQPDSLVCPPPGLLPPVFFLGQGKSSNHPLSHSLLKPNCPPSYLLDA